MFYDNYVELCAKNGKSPSGVAREIGLSNAAANGWKKGKNPNDTTLSKLSNYFGVPVSALLGTEKAPTRKGERRGLPPEAEPIDFSEYRRIPIMGRISAGLPIYADQNIEGYTMTDRNGGAEYFALRVVGDSMNAARIQEGDLVIVRRQKEVEQGEIAVVLVGDEDATVKRFYSSDTTVTLMPQSTNQKHKPQIYDTQKTSVQVLGKVVEVKFLI